MSETDDDDEKFPTGQMLTLAICKFSEPIAFNSVIAYTYPMVQWLHDGDDTNASFYAGLLVSAYAFGEVLTAVFWGWISDRVGRRPIVLFGLCGVAASCIMFGLAQSYWVALLARLMGGMLNGNVAVMQTMLAEMVKRPEHEPTAYAIHPFVWFAGGILGSAMGGYLAQPAQFYPDIFSPDGLFGRYPYLLPNIVSVGAIAIAVIQGAIFLKETKPRTGETARASGADDKHAVDERTPLIILDEEDSSDTATTAGNEATTSPVLHNDVLSGRANLQSISRDFQQPDIRTTFNFAVIMLITSLVISSYHSMAYGSLLPIYLLDKPQRHALRERLDLHGGLGYDLHNVGNFMAANGIIAMLVQIIVFPVFVRKAGVWKAFVSMTILYPLAYILMPFLSLLPAGWVRYSGIYVVMIIQNHMNIIIPPCALILIKNATPSMSVLGTVNGACMSSICAARTVAPPIEGIIYGATGSAAAWFSMAGVAFFAVIQLIWIPRELTEVSDGDAAVKPGKREHARETRSSLQPEAATSE